LIARPRNSRKEEQHYRFLGAEELAAAIHDAER